MWASLHTRPPAAGLRSRTCGFARSPIRTGERIGVTGRTGAYTWPSGAKDALGEVIWKGDRYWVSTVDFEMTLEQPYPAGQATPSGRRASRLQRRADSVSDSE